MKNRKFYLKQPFVPEVTSDQKNFFSIFWWKKDFCVFHRLFRKVFNKIFLFVGQTDTLRYFVWSQLFIRNLLKLYEMHQNPISNQKLEICFARMPPLQFQFNLIRSSLMAFFRDLYYFTCRSDNELITRSRPNAKCSEQTMIL